MRNMPSLPYSFLSLAGFGFRHFHFDIGGFSSGFLFPTTACSCACLLLPNKAKHTCIKIRKLGSCLNHVWCEMWCLTGDVMRHALKFCSTLGGLVCRCTGLLYRSILYCICTERCQTMNLPPNTDERNCKLIHYFAQNSLNSFYTLHVKIANAA